MNNQVNKTQLQIARNDKIMEGVTFQAVLKEVYIHIKLADFSVMVPKWRVSSQMENEECNNKTSMYFCPPSPLFSI